MPNPWTGVGNPYTRDEVIERLRDTLSKGEPIIAAGAGTGISAKFIEKGGADLIIIYNSGRYRMMGHGSIAGIMGYGDANGTAMEIGEYEVLPVVKRRTSSLATCSRCLSRSPNAWDGSSRSCRPRIPTLVATPRSPPCSAAISSGRV